jgi:threonine dehydrogenase-like Zn-dependent dehydrogenase
VSTGGGWGISFVAHESQLLGVPDDLTDEQAVLIEPAACAVHAARGVDSGEVAVIGAGTLGLLTIAAIRHLDELRGPLIATAKHPHQRTLAKELGADIVAEPDALPRHVRSVTRSWVIDDRLTCGADHVVDCVGSEQSLQQALDVCAPGGIVHVVGMPARTTLDLTGLWNRELTMTGCYAYTPDDFADALDLVRSADLGRLVSATYPLARYRDAIEHAASAGARGAVKIAFDLRNERERNR